MGAIVGAPRRDEARGGAEAGGDGLTEEGRTCAADRPPLGAYQHFCWFFCRYLRWARGLEARALLRVWQTASRSVDPIAFTLSGVSNNNRQSRVIRTSDNHRGRWGNVCEGCVTFLSYLLPQFLVAAVFDFNLLVAR